jgi:hypothetical protein
MKTPLFTIIMVITLIVLGGQTIKKACKTVIKSRDPPNNRGNKLRTTLSVAELGVLFVFIGYCCRSL